MQTKPKVSAMKSQTVKGGKVTKQVAVKTPTKKIMVMSESGKPQSLADRNARANAFARELDKIAKERAAATAPRKMGTDMTKKMIKYAGMKKK